MKPHIRESAFPIESCGTATGLGRQKGIWPGVGVLLAVVGIFLLSGCVNVIPQPIPDEELDFHLTLSSNEVVVDVGLAPFARLDTSQLVQIGIHLPVNPMNQVVGKTDGQLYALSAFPRTGGVQPLEIYPPGLTTFLPGDHVIGVSATVILYRLDQDDKAEAKYASTTTTNFTLRVRSQYVLPAPPASEVPAEGFAHVMDFGAPGAPPDAFVNLTEGANGRLFGFSALDGSLRAMDKSGTNDSLLTSFGTDSPAGHVPRPPLVRVGVVTGDTIRPMLAGVTRFGPAAAGDGGVFRIGEDGTDLSILRKFSMGSLGVSGYQGSRITAGRYGDLFVTTLLGGQAVDNNGTLTRIAAGGADIQILKAFRRRLGEIEGPLVLASDGRLYGVARGPNPFPTTPNYTAGVLFSLATDGTRLRDDLHAFEPPPLVPGFPGLSHTTFPLGGLIEASDGYLYGTHGHGVNWVNSGLIQTNLSYYYRVAKNGGEFTRLAGPGGRRSPPRDPLVEGSDGRLYGFVADNTNYLVAVNRSTGGLEYVQELGSSAVFVDQQHTTGGLVAASDGAIYGTVRVGGAFGRGFLFRYRPPAMGALVPNGGLVEGVRVGEPAPRRKAAPAAAPPQGESAAIRLAAIHPGVNAGRSVAFAADLLAVGVPYAHDPDFAGAVHLLKRQDVGWVEAGVLAPAGDGAGATRGFGASLSLRGDWLAVGATGFGGSNGVAGAAYVYLRTNGVWQSVARVAGANQTGDEFGASVSLDGATLMVGAPGETNRGIGSGAAWSFSRLADGTWLSRGRLSVPTQAAGDFLGTSVAVDGDYAVIGAPRGREGRFSFRPGAAHLFQRFTTGQWFLRTGLEADSAHPGDLFGASVAIAGTRVAVAMPGTPPTSATDPLGEWRGVVVYGGENQFWSEQDRLTAPVFQPQEIFGASLSMSSNRISVGAPRNPVFGLSAPGSAYVFNRDGNSWWLAAQFQSSTGDRSDAFGYSIAHAEGQVAVGAVLQKSPNSIPGGVYVFTVSHPRLEGIRQPSGLLLRWTVTAAEGWHLQSSDGLGPAAAWIDVAPPTEGNHSVESAAASRYYRLLRR